MNFTIDNCVNLIQNILGFEDFTKENIEKFEEYKASYNAQFFYGEFSNNFILTFWPNDNNSIIECCGYATKYCVNLEELKTFINNWK